MFSRTSFHTMYFIASCFRPHLYNAAPFIAAICVFYTASHSKQLNKCCVYFLTWYRFKMFEIVVEALKNKKFDKLK